MQPNRAHGSPGSRVLSIALISILTVAPAYDSFSRMGYKAYSTQGSFHHTAATTQTCGRASANHQSSFNSSLYTPTIKKWGAGCTFVFTIVSIGSAYSPFLDLTRNWALSAQSALDRRNLPFVIIGTDQLTCDIVSTAGISNCVVDDFTPGPSVWPAASRVDPVALNNVVAYKYMWTLQALILGYTVMYSDVDAAFHHGSDPIGYLVDDRVQQSKISSSSTGSSLSRSSTLVQVASDDEAIPDLQMVSDHEAQDHSCTTDFLCDLTLMASSSHSWVGHTYDQLLSQRQLSCFLTAGNHYPPGSSCISTGFWFAKPSTASLRLFEDVVHQLSSNAEWEQRLFNRVLPSHFNSDLEFVALDPRVLGNVGAQQCASMLASQPGQSSPSAECRDPPRARAASCENSMTAHSRVYTHTGYVQGSSEKLEALKSAGVWFVS